MEPRTFTDRHGVCSDLFISRREEGWMFVIGGQDEQGDHWSHTLTRRAAHLLWFKLTRLLYPQKADLVTALAVTAPLGLGQGEAVTTQVEVTVAAECTTITGWSIQERWEASLGELELRRFWTMLDLALYPVGWEGRTRKPRR